MMDQLPTYIQEQPQDYVAVGITLHMLPEDESLPAGTFDNRKGNKILPVLLSVVIPKKNLEEFRELSTNDTNIDLLMTFVDLLIGKAGRRGTIVVPPKGKEDVWNFISQNFDQSGNNDLYGLPICIPQGVQIYDYTLVEVYNVDKELVSKLEKFRFQVSSLRYRPAVEVYECMHQDGTLQRFRPDPQNKNRILFLEKTDMYGKDSYLHALNFEKELYESIDGSKYYDPQKREFLPYDRKNKSFLRR